MVFESAASHSFLMAQKKKFKEALKYYLKLTSAAETFKSNLQIFTDLT